MSRLIQTEVDNAYIIKVQGPTLPNVDFFLLLHIWQHMYSLSDLS